MPQAIAAVAEGNHTALEDALGRVKAWTQDRWDYWEFRKLLGGAKYVKKFCDSRTGFEQTSQPLTRFCAKALAPSAKKKRKKGKKPKRNEL